MLSDTLLTELHKLNRADKLRVLQIIANDLAAEENPLNIATEYEVWSPYDSAGAAQVLRQMLEDDRKNE